MPSVPSVFFFNLKKWKLIHSVKNIFSTTLRTSDHLNAWLSSKRVTLPKIWEFIANYLLLGKKFSWVKKKRIMNTNPIFSSLNHMYGEMSAYLVWAPVFNHSLATELLVQEWAFMFLYRWYNPFILLSLQTDCNCSMSLEEHVHDKSLKSSPLTQVCLCWNDKVNNILCFIFSSTWHIC